MSNVRYLSWSSMVLDASAEVRALGYLQVPRDLAEAREVLHRAIEHQDDAVRDDALTHLAGQRDPLARTILVESLEGALPYTVAAVRSAIGEIDVRRYDPDPRVVVPDVDPWPDLPTPPGFAERLHDIVTRWIAMQRRVVQQSHRMGAERGTPLAADDPWLVHTEREIAAYERVTLDTCHETVAALEGRGGRVHPLITELTSNRFSGEVAPLLTPMQRLRLEQHLRGIGVLLWGFDYTGVDLRNFADAVHRLGVRRPESLIARDYLLGGYLEPTLAWPFFVEHPERLDDCLGLAVPEAPVKEEWLVKALGVLAQMPVMPSRYLPRVEDLAVAGKARPRAAARRVVEAHGDPVALAAGALRHTRAPLRASAATWLGDLGATRALPELRSALAAEASAPARAAMSSAVDVLTAGAASDV